MNMPQAVYQYYLENRHRLQPDKRFHFGTRMAAWLGTPESYEVLQEARTFIAPEHTSIEALVAAVYTNPQPTNYKARELRAPFFKKYPELYGAQLALFRVRHLKEVYGIDARNALFAAISKEKLLALRAQLLNDTEALRALSTFAINYCYLFDTMLTGQPAASLQSRFLEVGHTYDSATAEQVQLLMYLYTHCIIGESYFYVRTIPEGQLPGYRQMLRELEPLIRTHFADISLDNKLEFLVCARICSYETDLFEMIYKECARSISPVGTFLIDTRHGDAQAKSNTFMSSEHRSVLFIMSASTYSPHSTLVSETLQ